MSLIEAVARTALELCMLAYKLRKELHQLRR